MQDLPQIAMAATAVFVFISIPMAIAVGVRRTKTGILLLHGEDETLLRLIRAHGNFVEYVPLALLALAAAELAGAAPWLVVCCGGTLLLARLIHYVSLSSAADHVGRPIGAGLTSVTMIVLALTILWELGTSM
ncbi:MAG: MAPEG family protein [Pseudomonadota bacterium]